MKSLSLLRADAEGTDTHMVPVFDAPTFREAPSRALVCVHGPDLGRVYRLLDTPMVIGRGGADIVLNGTDVSRRHAKFERTSEGATVMDLGSVNGTFVNGVRITDKHRIRVGDRLQIGASVLLFAQRDELEARIERVQRLEALATLAGGIAHDFNNALAVIVSSLEFIESELPPEAKLAHESMVDMWTATRSATALAKRLLRLGRNEPMTYTTVGLKSLVDHAMALAKRRFHPDVEIITKIEPGLEVLGSLEELQQALVNLYLNAGDAMPNGGELTTRARAIHCDEPFAVARQLPTPGPYIEIVVTDTGKGMDATTVARAFEPFFTTKARDKGTGLGLAMIHGTVRRHGGSIELHSEVGRGTTFTILLHRTPTP